MFDDEKGPIEHFSWGKFVVRGEEHSQDESDKHGAGKDIRLIGRKVTPWRERKGHLLTPEMITGVFDDGIRTLILGVGVEGALECPKSVVKSIKDRGIDKVILLATPDACRKYNELFHKGKKVALLAHGTC